MLIEDAYVASAEASPAAATSEGAGRALKAKEQFLQMLVAQISNQNPMNPMDDKEMVSQLAQFSAVEQAIETNSRLGALERAQGTATRLSTAGLIGHEGAASTKDLTLQEGAMVPPVVFSLDGFAKEATVRVIDSDGRLVRSIPLEPMGPGAHSVPWDGKGHDRLPLPPGTYRTRVEAHNQVGAEVSVQHEIRGTIQKIDLEGRDPAVYIGGRRVPLAEVTQISQ